MQMQDQNPLVELFRHNTWGHIAATGCLRDPGRYAARRDGSRYDGIDPRHPDAYCGALKAAMLPGSPGSFQPSSWSRPAFPASQRCAS